MLVAPDRLPSAGAAEPEQVSGVVGVVALCLVSAALWIVLIWTLLAVLG